MATLHKFKLLATQCAVAGSPTRSPTASPVIHLRRRRTLRMFLHRRRHADPPPHPSAGDEVRVRRKLKDLFISSPPSIHDDDDDCEEKRSPDFVDPSPHESFSPAISSSGRFRTVSVFRRGGAASLRPVSAAFRYRFLKRGWRPVLVTIPE